MKLILKVTLLLFFSLIQDFCDAQISGVINSYGRVNTITGNQFVVQDISLAPGLTIDDAFGVGQKVLIIQMKGAQINTTNDINFGSLVSYGNAGNYEFATIETSSGSTTNRVIRVESLSRTYDVTGAVQLVSVPQYLDVTVVGDIQAIPWDRTLGRGGIVTLEVSNTLTLEADITVNGQGFEGGSRNTVGQNATCNNSSLYVSQDVEFSAETTGHNHAQKGESIVDYAANGISGQEYGRGAILNGGGGGNSHNGGGGGGGNYTPGGNAGIGWQPRGGCAGGPNIAAGIGAYSLGYSLANNKIFMGGGGGGGQQNNSHASDGANGGGIIIVRAQNLLVTNTAPRGLYANGADAQNSTGNDASGGGGGGGVIVLDILNYTLNNTFIARANGGSGGSVAFNEPHAGGGGGGVGVLLLNNAPPTGSDFNSIPGTPGGDCNAGCTNVTGTAGGVPTTPYIINWQVTGSLNPLPIELKSFDVKQKDHQAWIEWVTLMEENTDYFVIQRSQDLKEIEEIAQQKAKGNSNYEVNYQAVDNQPHPGISYYRLKSVDYDGEISYSTWKSIALNLEKKLDFIIYPNPCIDIIHFKPKDSEGKYNLILFNEQGRVCYQATFKGQFDYHTQQLPKGEYLVKICSEARGLFEAEFVVN